MQRNGDDIAGFDAPSPDDLEARKIFVDWKYVPSLNFYGRLNEVNLPISMLCPGTGTEISKPPEAAVTVPSACR